MKLKTFNNEGIKKSLLKAFTSSVLETKVLACLPLRRHTW